MSSSLFVKCRKRRRSSTENLCADQSDEGFLSSSDILTGSKNVEANSFCEAACVGLPSEIVCAKQRDETFNLDEARLEQNDASYPPRCMAVQAHSEDSSTGSSCFSSFREHGRSRKQKMLTDCMPSGEAESESGSCCGSNDGDVDIAAFLHEQAVCDDASSEGFSFNPETVFVNDVAVGDCSLVEDAPFFGFSAENGSWFLNDLDSEGKNTLNEVLDQEWMAAAFANLDKLNDTITSDTCVLHLVESDDVGNGF